MKSKRNLLLSLMLIFILTVSGCTTSEEASTEELSSESTTVDLPAESTTDELVLDDVILESIADETIAGMSIDQKIGQLFIVNTDLLDKNAQTKMTKKMKNNIMKYHPGGVVLFSDNIVKRKQTRKFIEKLQQNSIIPMFIAVDEEGGSVSRVAKNKKMKTTRFPSMKKVGMKADEEYAYEIGKTIGTDLSTLGFNLDFAPVCDLVTDPDNVEIGDRSFGSDPYLVASMVSAMVKGFHDGGVATSLKHFPGQGEENSNTHEGFSDVDVTIDVLRERELVPFKEGIAAGADMLMMAHVALSTITSNKEPSSLSELVINEIVRGELEYEGVVITDAMNMKAITKYYDQNEAVLKAIEAGNDIILMPNDLEQAFNAIKDAIDSGRLSVERIDESVKRIIKCKLLRNIMLIPEL